jgi:3-methyladenine DNA glycosylase AlkD
MKIMDMQTAIQTGEKIVSQLESGGVESAFALLAPILAERTPFRFLDRIGSTIGVSEFEAIDNFLERVAAENTEGGWPVIGSVLRSQMDRDLEKAFSRAQHYIIAADVWYGADILGERVPGPGLATHFEVALPLLSAWRENPNQWVRRAVGVAVHFWAKRAKGNPALDNQALVLLDLLEPMFTEREIDAVKGVGWGLKTMGRYYPNLMVTWLPKQVGRRHQSIVLNKAMKFLTETQKKRIRRKM